MTTPSGGLPSSRVLDRPRRGWLSPAGRRSVAGESASKRGPPSLPGSAASASLSARNTGSRAGEEVVQLYLHDVVATVARPVKQLVGFQRVALGAGESAEVSFRVHADRTAFTGHDLQRVVEPGDIDVLVGASATNLPVSSPGSADWSAAYRRPRAPPRHPSRGSATLVVRLLIRQGSAPPGRRSAAFSSSSVQHRYDLLLGLAEHPPRRRNTPDESTGATTSHRRGLGRDRPSRRVRPQR